MIVMRRSKAEPVGTSETVLRSPAFNGHPWITASHERGNNSTRSKVISFMLKQPLRLWPGAVIVVLQWFAFLVVPAIMPDARLSAILVGAGGCTVAMLIWWLFFSRAPRADRIGAVLIMAVAVVAARPLVHPSISGAGMGFLIYVLAAPLLCLALLIWAALCGRMPARGLRWTALAAAAFVACGFFSLLRTGGISGEGESDFHWRWTKSPEERLLAGNEKLSPALPGVSAPKNSTAEWPGFRGANRDGVIRGAAIATDWNRDPPVELWRRPVGPGWSSFAVSGDWFYTQEQRGDDELVSCYSVATGAAIWAHHDAARFWESNAGAGPRATPTLGDNRVYTLGATGIVNALRASDGTVVWSRDAAADTGAKLPGWGFAGSPLLVDDLVIVAASGRLVAYDRTRGSVRWTARSGGGGYSSPHLATIGGARQVILVNGSGAAGFEPSTGAELWKHPWEGDGIVQPGQTADGDVLLGSGSGMGGAVGVIRVSIAQRPNGWAAEERWKSKGLKPYFNDFVLHAGHAYGFDGALLACMDLTDGRRRWKNGRFGHGQLILLADQNLLLVVSEKGGVALVAASPDGFRELSRFTAIEGKTWNHPALVGDVLLVRNAEEMAAYRLHPAGK